MVKTVYHTAVGANGIMAYETTSIANETRARLKSKVMEREALGASCGVLSSSSEGDESGWRGSLGEMGSWTAGVIKRFRSLMITEEGVSLAVEYV